MIRFCKPCTDLEIDNNRVDLNHIVMDKNIFNNVHNILSRNKADYVYICNQKNDVIFYAFDQQDFRYDQVESFLVAIRNYDINLAEHIESGYKSICIHGINELSYALYVELSCKKQNVNVCGEEWINLAEKEDIISLEKGETNRQGVFHLYAEGVGGYQFAVNDLNNFASVGGNFQKIINAGINIGKKMLAYTIENLNENVEVCFCHVPINYPFYNSYSKKFCEIDEVHNKIQGYKLYCNDEEKQYVRDIYEVCYKAEANNNNNDIVFSLNSVIGTSSLKERKPNRVFIVGPCIVSGYCVSEEFVFSTVLQKKIEKYNYEIIRISISKINWVLMDFLRKVSIRDKDIILFISEIDSFPEECNHQITHIDLSECYMTMNPGMPWFSDVPSHLNKNGHKRIAEYIYQNYLKDEIQEKSNGQGVYIQVGEKDRTIESEIAKYVLQYKVDHSGVVGSIVMNCNPFTNGHRYLIETALEQVEILYVFVVQEDRSFFPFEQRIKMVKLGVKDLSNVIVIPSGRFVLSAMTLKSYFEKEEKQDVMIDASQDIEIFGKYVAPKFNIKYRFCGAEPLDNITRQYNEQMKKLLPQFGIKFVEIERKKSDGKYISASRVRKAMKSGRLDSIKNLVPQSTWEYIYRY